MLQALRAWLFPEPPVQPVAPTGPCEVRLCPHKRAAGVRVCATHLELVQRDAGELEQGCCPLCARLLARTTKIKVVGKTKKGCTYACPFHGVTGFVYDVSE